MKKLNLLMLLLTISPLVLLTACELPTVTPVNETPTATSTQIPVTNTPQSPTETPEPTQGVVNWKGVFVYNMDEFVHQVPVIMPNELEPLGALERHVMPTDPYTAPYSFIPFYLACNYFSLPSNTICADSFSELIGGDPAAYLGRPEYKIDPFRNGNEYSTQLFSDGRPMKAGWQTWIELPEGVVAQDVSITFDIQLWANPIFNTTPPYPITEYSKPVIMPEADDIRAVEFFTFVSDVMYMRDSDWIQETYFGDPTAESWVRNVQSEEVYVGLEVNEMPYDHWKTYTVDYSFDDVTDGFYFGLGVLSRFGWGTNFYVRSIAVEVDGYSMTIIPTETPYPTPTPIVPITPTPTEEPTATPDPTIRPDNAHIDVAQLNGNFFFAITGATFGDHFINWSDTVREGIPASTPMSVAALYKDPDSGALWFASDGYWKWSESDKLYIWETTEWFPWYANLSEWAGGVGVNMRWFGYFIGDEIPELPLE